MSKKIIQAIAGGALLTALLAAPLFAQPATDFAAVRKATMKEIAGASQVIRTQAMAEAPDMAAVKTAAASLSANATKLYTLFPAGSGAPAGMPGAKPEIWTMPAEFKTAQDNFASATSALTGAADAAAFKAAAPGLTQACGGCHRTFRAQAPGAGRGGGGAPGAAPGGAPGGAPPRAPGT